MRRTLVALGVAVLLAGCGGGGEATVSTTAGSTAEAISAAGAVKAGATSHRTGSPRATTPQAASRTRAHHDAATGAASFETKGGDNSIQESGSEAGASEVSQAAAALHGYLNARAAGEWSKACSYMAAGVTAQLSQLTAGGAAGKKAPPCAKLLAGFSAGVPAAAMREAAEADVGALRVEDESAFLLYHGAHSTDYFMPMSRESGHWKVAAIAPSPLG
jgi:hypothetical protein